MYLKQVLLQCFVEYAKIAAVAAVQKFTRPASFNQKSWKDCTLSKYYYNVSKTSRSCDYNIT